MVLTNFWRLPDRVGDTFGRFTYDCVRPLGRYNIKKLEKTLHDHNGMSLAAVANTKRGTVMAVIFITGIRGICKVMLSACFCFFRSIMLARHCGGMRLMRGCTAIILAGIHCQKKDINTYDGIH
jgi:hypothetical protein